MRNRHQSLIRLIVKSPVLKGFFGAVGIASIAAIPSSCSSGGVGDPCIPEDEYNASFQGFKVTEENIESRSFQCETRICLVNHFQGRVSCPLGQGTPQTCAGPDDNSCSDGESCTESVTLAPDCTQETAAQKCGQFGGVCEKNGGFCSCSGDDTCPAGFSCDSATKQCKSYVCHAPGNCQVRGGDNSGDQDCCIPGTDTPVGTFVCGNCDTGSSRDADDAVYCSCRCGVAEGEEEDPNFNFCECPDGFECSEIRKNVGLGDEQITGKYCIRQGTGTDATQAGTECGEVQGSFSDAQCDGRAPAGS